MYTCFTSKLFIKFIKRLFGNHVITFLDPSCDHFSYKKWSQNSWSVIFSAESCRVRLFCTLYPTLRKFLCPYPPLVSSHMYRAVDQQMSLVLCDRTKKKMPFVGLEPHTFCYPGRCPKPVRLEGTSHRRLASECIITDANTPTLWTCYPNPTGL